MPSVYTVYVSALCVVCSCVRASVHHVCLHHAIPCVVSTLCVRGVSTLCVYTMYVSTPCTCVCCAAVSMSQGRLTSWLPEQHLCHVVSVNADCSSWRNLGHIPVDNDDDDGDWTERVVNSRPHNILDLEDNGFGIDQPLSSAWKQLSSLSRSRTSHPAFPQSRLPRMSWCSHRPGTQCIHT